MYWAFGWFYEPRYIEVTTFDFLVRKDHQKMSGFKYIAIIVKKLCFKGTITQDEGLQLCVHDY